jgi:hypothetical protein
MRYPSGWAAVGAPDARFSESAFLKARSDWTVSADPPLSYPWKAANRKEVPAATP